MIFSVKISSCLVVNISHFLGLGQKKIRIPNSYNTNDLGILTKLLNIFNRKLAGEVLGASYKSF
jgi:hypothetical protein